MAKGEAATVKDAIDKLQLCLLKGIKDEKHLLVAWSLLSLSDYQDVVTGRSIENKCGYPLCSNSLSSERPQRGHYKISSKEHKVYDLHETYMYCSTNCAANSGAFAGSLQDERSSTMNPAELNEVLNLFKGLHLRSAEDGARDKQLLKSSLKSSNSKKMARSVTWADGNIDDGTCKKTQSLFTILEYESQAYDDPY